MGCVQKKRQGTRRSDRNPTDVHDIVLGIDMLIDTRLRRDRLGLAGPTAKVDAALNEADVRCDNALNNLKDVLGRWQR